MSLIEQMRRIRRSNAFFRQMPSDAQIRRILSFFDGLMPRPRVVRCLLLCPDALSQFFVANFKLAPCARHVFFYGGKFGLSSVQLFLRRTHRVAAAHAFPPEFVA